MASVTFNDYGSAIYAIGAPGSRVRCELEFPRLLAHIQQIPEQEAIDLLETTALAPMEKENLLISREHPYYGQKSFSCS